MYQALTYTVGTKVVLDTVFFLIYRTTPLSRLPLFLLFLSLSLSLSRAVCLSPSLSLPPGFQTQQSGLSAIPSVAKYLEPRWVQGLHQSAPPP